MFIQTYFTVICNEYFIDPLHILSKLWKVESNGESKYGFFGWSDTN